MPIEEGGASRKRNIAAFASAELGWKSLVYLTLTGRTDWPSQLVNTQEEAIFYPSVGLSGVLTELLSDEQKQKNIPNFEFCKSTRFIYRGRFAYCLYRTNKRNYN